MRMAECHPDRKYVAKGRCRECYQKAYLNNPDNRKRKNEYYSSEKWTAYRSSFYKTKKERTKQKLRREVKAGKRPPLPKRPNKYAPAEVEDKREKLNDYKFAQSEHGKISIKRRYQERKSREEVRARLRAEKAAYRAARKQRTVAWSDKEKLFNIYKNVPHGMTVDHIIPLQGENVSGLHVPDNLQYLTLEENSSKNNSFDFTLQNESWRIKLTEKKKACSIDVIPPKEQSGEEV